MPASEKPFTVAIQVGRLVEVRVGVFTTRAQLAQAQAAMANALRRVRNPILCSDARGTRPLSEDLAEGTLQVMRGQNSLFYRNAILVGSPTFALQVARLSREANHPQRRLFDNSGQLVVWLRPHLNDEEFDRLQAFIEEPPLGDDAPPNTYFGR